MSTLITNIGELVTNAPQHAADDSGRGGGRSSRGGRFGALHDAALVIEDRRVAWCGPAAKAPAADHVVNAEGRAALPGFVDSHAHLVFAGERRRRARRPTRGCGPGCAGSPPRCSARGPRPSSASRDTG